MATNVTEVPPYQRIELRFECSLGISRLRFEPVLGRRTVYGKITIGRTTFWVQRWDTGRSPNNRFKSRDGLMGWTWGVRR